MNLPMELIHVYQVFPWPWSPVPCQDTCIFISLYLICTWTISACTSNSICICASLQSVHCLFSCCFVLHVFVIITCLSACQRISMHSCMVPCMHYRHHVCLRLADSTLSFSLFHSFHIFMYIIFHTCFGMIIHDRRAWIMIKITIVCFHAYPISSYIYIYIYI